MTHIHIRILLRNSTFEFADKSFYNDIWDGHCALYTINIGQIPRTLRFLEEQLKFLFQHQQQLARWIMLLETISHRLSAVINVMWKSIRQKIIKVDINRHHTDQKVTSLSSTEPWPNVPASSPTRRGNECCAYVNVLGIQQLCQDKPINSSSSLEERLVNLTSFDPYGNKRSDITLWRLPHDLETQYSHDIPSLLRILTSIYPFNETSSNLLYDYEIEDFLKLYDISNICPILASDDGYVFWLQNNAGTIYIWSRVESCMLYVGKDLREALINYLFHQDNICYVIEFTYEIIPRNEVKQKARELAESCKHITLEVSNKPLKEDGKRKKKKKGQKKKNKH